MSCSNAGIAPPCVATDPQAGAVTDPRWTNATGTVGSGPPCREGAAVAFSSQLGMLVLFGGTSTSCPGGGSRYLGDTWVYFGGHWRNASPSSGPSPSARAWAGLADDPATSEVVLFGGIGPAGALNDTWTFNGSAWSNRTGAIAPSPRADPSLAYSGSLGAVVLFGGEIRGAPGVPGNDTWTFVQGTWSNHSTAGAVAPTGVSGASLAYNPIDGQMVLFGGLAANGTALNSTWGLGSTGWSERATALSPVGRTDAGLAFDPYLEEMVLFGGCPTPGCTPAFSDTWLLNATGWSEVPFAPTSHPSSVPAMEVVADPAGGFELALVDDGGSTDTWLFGAPVITAFSAQPNDFDLGGVTSVSASVATNGIPVSFTLEGLPPGCSAPNAPALVCTPTALGTFRLTVVVATTLGYVTNASVILAVNPDPAISSAYSVPSRVTVGIPLSLSVIVSGGTPPFSYSYFGLPPGCATENLTPLPCTPSAVGSFAVGVRVTDADGASAWATIEVPVDGPPTVNSAAFVPTTVDVGEPAQLRVSTSNGSPPLAYSFIGLPGGCQAPAPPVVNCTATAAGDFETLVEVRDAFGVMAFANASLTVNPRPTITSFGPVSGSPQTGQRLSLAAQVSGGTAPLRFSYAGLPTGCTSADSPQLNCTPADSGGYVVSVTVTDGTGATAVANSTLNVSASAGGSGGSGLWGLPTGFALLVLSAVAAGAAASVITARLTRRAPLGQAARTSTVGSTMEAKAQTEAPENPGGGRAAEAGAGPPALVRNARPNPVTVPTSAGPLSEQILLHLRAQGTLTPDAVASRECTQEGISDALGRPQSSFARVLQRLSEQGLIEVQTRHVRGVSRRRKAYVLTPRGHEVAKDVRLNRSAARLAEREPPEN